MLILVGKMVGLLKGATKIALGENPNYPVPEPFVSLARKLLVEGGSGGHAEGGQRDLRPAQPLIDQINTRPSNSLHSKSNH